MKQPDTEQDDRLAAAISIACEGLVYVSETDAPVTLFITEGLNDLEERSLKKWFALSDDVPIEIAEPDRFFGRYEARRPVYSPAQKKIARGFRELRDELENLKDLSLVRIGRTVVDIYVVGLGRSGRVMGVATRAIET